MKIKIFASCADAVSKKLARISRKAQKAGKVINFSISTPRWEVFTSGDGSGLATHNAILVADVEVDAERLVCHDGWQVVASIEHLAGGNVVTTFSGASDPAWFTVSGRCDHCGTNRVRKYTFIVRNDGGEYKQVGKSCLKDFTGISPADCALWAEVRELDISQNDTGMPAPSADRGLSVQEVIAHACDSITALGYIKSCETSSTKSDIISRLGISTPSSDSVEEAKKIIQWVRETYANKGRLELSELESNWLTLCMDEYTTRKHIGYLAYLPVAYRKDMAKKEEARKVEMAGKCSEFVGNVGERITFTAKTAGVLTSWDSQWGTTYLIQFTDENGNIFKWFASKFDANKLKNGCSVAGTVKEHSEYKGVNQTVLTRCRIK